MPQLDTGQAVQVGIQGGAIAASAGLALAGSMALIPVVGLIAAPIALAAALIFNSANGQQKQASTGIVNQLEPLLKQNLAAYLAGPRTAAAQASACAYFDQAFAMVQSSQGCGNPSLGDAGGKCIKDRQRGGKWDWYKLYRDPISSDPIANGTSPASPSYTTLQTGSNAAPITSSAAAWLASTGSTGSSAAAAASSGISPLYIAAGLIAAVLVFK